jgi:hypothetical protein
MARLLSRGFGGERVVGAERVWRDDLIADAGIVGEQVLDRWRCATGSATLVEHVGNRLRGNGIAIERDGDRGVDLVGAEAIEEMEQARRRAAEMSAAERELGKERLRVRASGGEAVTTTELGGASFRFDERREVRGILDGAAAIIAARVRGDLDASVEEPEHRFGGDESERFPNDRGGDRIVVEIEAHVRRLAGPDRPHERAFEGMLGERQEPRALLVEGIADGPTIGITGNRPGVCNPINPFVELAIEIRNGSEAPRCEERVS